MTFPPVSHNLALMDTRNSRDPWDERFGFFWYNDREIFHSTDADLRREAEGMAEAGINHVITFSCTHFRWSFRRWWPLLTETLSRVVEACHASGIRVTEHHSSHLTFNPLNADDDAYMDRVLAVRKSARGSWPGLREDCDADPLLDGVPMSSCRQIDGRTGRWARTSYRGWGLCFNNPDYRKAYFSYLETLYRTGIDGIMTDDVQYFGEGHACACAHCRRLYRERTGRDLPQPGDAWTRWHGNYGDPSYVAWLAFREASTKDFHEAVAAHYGSLGLRPFRPNYCSTVLARNWTAYCLETLPHLDWIFQENCFSTIIRYSWPSWAVEAAHRRAVGRRRGIPPMSMFYPDQPDTMRFSWALAMSWGQLYLATPEGASLATEEKALRDFEKAHARLLHGVRSAARIGFYDSRDNRTSYGKAEARSLRQLSAWLQACQRLSVPVDLFQTEELDRLPGYAVVVCHETAVLSDGELAAFASFARSGGTLVLTGATGALRHDGTPRAEADLAAALGVPGFRPAPDGAKPAVHATGSGRIVAAAGDWGSPYVEGCVNADRWQAEEVRVAYKPLGEDGWEARRGIAAFLAGFLPGGPDLEVRGLPQDVVATVYAAADGLSLVLHLVNAVGTAAVDGAASGVVGHSDGIPPRRLPDAPPASVAVRVPEGRRTARVLRYAPAGASGAAGNGISVEFTQEGNRLTVRFPPSAVGEYALVEAVLQPPPPG